MLFAVGAKGLEPSTSRMWTVTIKVRRNLSSLTAKPLFF